MNSQDFNDSFRASADGFSIELNGQRHDFRDEHIGGFAYRSTNSGENNHEEIVFGLVTRDHEAIVGRISNTCPIDQSNPISSLRQRIQSKLVEQSKQQMLADSTVAGPRWTMTAERLTDLTRDETVSLSELHSANWDGDTFIVWSTADIPFITLHRLELNTPLLSELISTAVPRRKASRHGGGIGNVYAEFRGLCERSKRLRLRIAITGVVCGIVLFTACRTPGSALATVVFVAAITTGLRHVAAKHFGSDETLLHGEFGLQLKGDDNTTTIDWDEANQMQFRAIDNYVNGTYVATHVFLEVSDKSHNAIAHSWSVGRSELQYRQIEALRDDAARHIGDAMWKQLQQHGQVAWTEGIVLSKDGMSLELASQDQSTTYPFTDVSTWQINEGRFGCCLLGEWDKRLACSTNSPNFYPGLLLFEKLMRPQQATRVATA